MRYTYTHTTIEQAMTTRQHAIECASRELIAWVRSGNSIPVSPTDVVKNEKFWKDVDKLDQLINN